MPNNLHCEGTTTNTSLAFYFKHPATGTYVAGTLKPGTTNTYTTDLTGVAAGTYATDLVGTIGAPSSTNTTTYPYQGAAVTVLNSPAPAPTPAPTGGGTDTRTAIDSATGIPAGLVFEGPLMVLSGMAGTDGVIRITGRNFADTGTSSPIILNCGSTPVVLSNCRLKHSINQRGIDGGGGVHLTMTDVAIYGGSPVMDGTVRQQSIYLYQPSYVDISYLTQEAGGGIKIDGWQGGDNLLRITNVRSRNVIGLSGDYRHCVQLANVHSANIQVQYVESYNEPGKSRIEDTINLYNAGGTSTTTPLRGKGFYLHGSYPFPVSDTTFSGAALSADGSGNTNEVQSQFIKLQDAWLVSNCNAAANIATGNNIAYSNLHAVTSGYLPDGSLLASSYAGFWIGDYYNLGAGANNTMTGITTHFMRTKDVFQRNDFSLDAAGKPSAGIDVAGAVLLPDTTGAAAGLAQENTLFIQWRDYLNANNQTCGSRYRG